MHLLEYVTRETLLTNICIQENNGCLSMKNTTFWKPKVSNGVLENYTILSTQQ
jgi:hypothetical protein